MTSLERIQFTAPTQADWNRAIELNRAMARRGLFWSWAAFAYVCLNRPIRRRQISRPRKIGYRTPGSAAVERQANRAHVRVQRHSAPIQRCFDSLVQIPKCRFLARRQTGCSHP
jgi:hypothetical protein